VQCVAPVTGSVRLRTSNCEETLLSPYDVTGVHFNPTHVRLQITSCEQSASWTLLDSMAHRSNLSDLTIAKRRQN